MKHGPIQANTIEQGAGPKASAVGKERPVPRSSPCRVRFASPASEEPASDRRGTPAEIGPLSGRSPDPFIAEVAEADRHVAPDLARRAQLLGEGIPDEPGDPHALIRPLEPLDVGDFEESDAMRLDPAEGHGGILGPLLLATVAGALTFCVALLSGLGIWATLGLTVLVSNVALVAFAVLAAVRRGDLGAGQ
ncbi:hypothetical protein [Jannaschia formosa]|uniref:hypothetical protein n=1 Tax=Jannaschia formosa TaxID=2259592 RepID=UPI000E1C144A|nr:hypothetical protein [Jannaschia formosa]TFL19591.1 hypothetical protein DR046_03560 [Jannaschia formosa]